MPLFSINDYNAKRISSISLSKEKNIQKIFEENLIEILEITFLESEYSTSSKSSNFRIDTLGIDDKGSPIIIEYKRTQNGGIINQGISYLNWLTDHKAEFEALVQKKKLDIKVNWASPRIICVAESYNRYDLGTVDYLFRSYKFKIELVKFFMYQGNILLVDFGEHQSEVFKKGEKEKNIEEKIQYTLEDHFRKMNPKTRKIFDKIHEKIIMLDESIRIESLKTKIAYKLITNVVDISPQKDSLQITLNIPSGKLDDQHKIAKDKSNIGKWGTGAYQVKLEEEEKIDQVFELIKQSYNYHR